MNEVSDLVELAKKATLGRNYDRLDSCGGGIKYKCLGNDGSLVLQCDHKNNEYGFIGPKAAEDEAFFLACKPETIIAIVEEFMMLQQQLTATTNILKSAGIEADTVQAGVMELVSRVDGISHECGMMMGLLNDVYRYHEECTHDDMMHALIPLEYVSAINGFVERDVDGENPCPITDAYLNAVRAEGFEWNDRECLEFLTVAFRHAEIKGDIVFDDIRLGVKMVNQLRAGNAGKDGSHE